MEDVIDFAWIESGLNEAGCTVEPCGSRVTCDPPPSDTDQDYLVEAPQAAISDIVAFLSQANFRWEGASEHYQNVAQSDFMSWRRDDVNLIITANADFAKRHRAATALCKRLNLMVKADRIALFQAVLYGVTWNGAAKAPREVKDEPVF